LPHRFPLGFGHANPVGDFNKGPAATTASFIAKRGRATGNARGIGAGLHAGSVALLPPALVSYNCHQHFAQLSYSSRMMTAHEQAKYPKHRYDTSEISQHLDF